MGYVGKVAPSDGEQSRPNVRSDGVNKPSELTQQLECLLAAASVVELRLRSEIMRGGLAHVLEPYRSRSGGRLSPSACEAEARTPQGRGRENVPAVLTCSLA